MTIRFFGSARMASARLLQITMSSSETPAWAKARLGRFQIAVSHRSHVQQRNGHRLRQNRRAIMTTADQANFNRTFGSPPDDKAGNKIMEVKADDGRKKTLLPFSIHTGNHEAMGPML